MDDNINNNIFNTSHSSHIFSIENGHQSQKTNLS